ncbi:hypothetical protein Tco_1318827 [Tanacetum coccineum]
MPPEDEVLLAKEQPPPAAVSPTADSLGYVLESDPEEDPANGEDDGDDEDESSDDDDDVDIEGDDDEEEEHLASADSIAVTLPNIDHAPFAEETKPFETGKSTATPPPHPAYRVTARISIKPQTRVLLPSDSEIERLLALPSPLSPLIRAKTSSPSYSPSSSAPPARTPPLLPILLPTSSPPLLLPSIDCRANAST